MLLGLNNPLAQGLGKILYSIYLVHEPVLILTNAGLLHFAPGLSSFSHFWSLFGIGLAATILSSVYLYCHVEVPGLELGKQFARQLRGVAAQPA